MRSLVGVGPPGRGGRLRVGRSPEGGVGLKIKKARFAGKILGGRGAKKEGRAGRKGEKAEQGRAKEEKRGGKAE